MKKRGAANTRIFPDASASLVPRGRRSRLGRGTTGPDKGRLGSAILDPHYERSLSLRPSPKEIDPRPSHTRFCAAGPVIYLPSPITHCPNGFRHAAERRESGWRGFPTGGTGATGGHRVPR